MWQKTNNDRVCFEARDDQYGAFNVTKTGLVKGIKHVHRNGSIKCNPSDIATYWSCSNADVYASNSFMTIIINSSRQALLPSEEKIENTTSCNYKKHFYVLEGVNQGAPELVLGTFKGSLSLLKGQQLQIWYGQDWKDCSEKGNSGTTCVDVFTWYM